VIFPGGQMKCNGSKHLVRNRYINTEHTATDLIGILMSGLSRFYHVNSQAKNRTHEYESEESEQENDEGGNNVSKICYF
jgi:hypothetical protein